MTSNEPKDSDFIGRHPEMALMTTALNDVLSGRGRLIMLVGEPGIGKTRTAQELASRANAEGAHVLWGWCYDQEGAPAYWPWVQAIRYYVQQREPDILRLEMGPGAADIAEIVPEISQKIRGLIRPPPLDTEESRFRLFDSTVNFFKTAANDRPLVLVLDDLQWADRPSLLLLEFLARQIAESRILIIGCYRDTELTRHHPLPETLAKLSREPVFKRLSLRGLSQEDFNLFIKNLPGAKLPQELMNSVYERTEGNPFFIEETIRLLSDEGDSPEERYGSAREIRVPDGVREVIGQRLNRLSEDSNQVLTMASVIGREFDFNLLRTMDQTFSEEQWLSSIDEGIAAHLIEEVAKEIGRYRFSHALIQQSLREELTTSRRVRLHARVGESLEELYGGDDGDRASDLAYHFAEAEAAIGPEKVVRYSMVAGERALATHAHEDALFQYNRGLLALGVPLNASTPARDQITADLLFGLGRAQVGSFPSSRMHEAVVTLTRSFEFFAGSGDVEKAVAVAGYQLPPNPGYITGAGSLILKALELIQPNSLQAGHLQSALSQVKGIEEGDFESANHAYNVALEIASITDNFELESHTLSVAADVDGFHLRWPEALEKGLRLEELSSPIDDRRAELSAHTWCFLPLLLAGDLKASTAHAAAMLAPAEFLRHHIYSSRAFYAIALAAWLAGDFHKALEFCDRGLAASPHDPSLLSTKAIIEYELGNEDNGYAALDQLINNAEQSAEVPNRERIFSALTIPAVNRIVEDANLAGAGERFSKGLLSSATSTPQAAAFARIGSGLLSIYSDESDHAAECYTALAGSPGVDLGILFGYPAGRILGLLARTSGNPEKAHTRFEQGLTFCRLGGFKPALAWTCCDYGESLLDLNQYGRLGRANDLLDESMSISVELGMRPLTERVLAIRERTASSPMRAPLYPDGLTPREVEVLMLVTAGKTDREIAAALVIAVRTVGTHVGNILKKTGAVNRTEAANYANQRGLVKPLNGD